MEKLGIILFVALLALFAGNVHHAEVQIQNWTCGYGGLCRRFCFDQEYIVGQHGCPRRYRCCAVRF
ncbi:defensin, beta-like 2 [Puntigrus tetrazona]|uniref:defensin, beta-like 2 n=1 Tax=Puntigrus tetrazona TaxID=1606681 RepID=UPI001C8AB1D9|nr:defensin, beta-like 2 [Puntigrus tetrazona]